jgi:hypothetical protein
MDFETKGVIHQRTSYITSTWMARLKRSKTEAEHDEKKDEYVQEDLIVEGRLERGVVSK